MANNYKYDLRQITYIDGNTVRKEAVFAPPSQQPFTEEKKKINKRIAVNKEPARISWISMVGILVAAAITLGLCIDYVQLQTDIRVRLENINELEAELNGLVSENRALENQVSSYIDLDYVYGVATEELGMQYPKSNQIVYYEDVNSEYVRQYGEISSADVEETDIYAYFGK